MARRRLPPSTLPHALALSPESDLPEPKSAYLRARWCAVPRHLPFAVDGLFGVGPSAATAQPQPSPAPCARARADPDSGRLAAHKVQPQREECEHGPSHQALTAGQARRTRLHDDGRDIGPCSCGEGAVVKNALRAARRKAAVGGSLPRSLLPAFFDARFRELVEGDLFVDSACRRRGISSWTPRAPWQGDGGPNGCGRWRQQR